MNIFSLDAMCRVVALMPIVVAMAMMMGFAAPASADVAKVNGHLQRAESNLKSVAGSVAGKTTPPTGSAAKVLANRLQQALDDITPAKALLEAIPAGTPGRDEAQARCDEAEKEYNRLRAFLSNSATPTAQPSGTKLDYQQEEVLKGARFNLREVEAGAEHLTGAVARLRGVADPLSIDHREVGGLLGVVENVTRKSGFVKDALAKLPADGAGVAEVGRAVADADAKVAAAAAFLRPLDARLKEVIDPTRYPQFQADLNRLRDLGVMFGDPMMFQADRVRAAATVKEAEAARGECVRIAQAYARLVEQGTEQGKMIEGAGNNFLKNLERFMAEADAQKASLPEAIRADLTKAKQQGDEAVAQQKPAWFATGGGIPQTMEWARERVVLLSAMDEVAGKQMQGEVEQAEKDLKVQADSLRELIIRANTMPKDAFKGEDREKAIATALSGWKMQQENAEVLAVRIPAEQWARETKWTYSNGTWYFSDRSKLQVRLIVADHENPALAIDRPINVWKDHQKGDAMIGVPLDGFKDVLQPQRYLLRANVKK